MITNDYRLAFLRKFMHYLIILGSAALLVLFTATTIKVGQQALAQTVGSCDWYEEDPENGFPAGYYTFLGGDAGDPNAWDYCDPDSDAEGSTQIPTTGQIPTDGQIPEVPAPEEEQPAPEEEVPAPEEEQPAPEVVEVPVEVPVPVLVEVQVPQPVPVPVPVPTVVSVPVPVSAPVAQQQQQQAQAQQTVQSTNVTSNNTNTNVNTSTNTNTNTSSSSSSSSSAANVTAPQGQAQPVTVTREVVREVPVTREVTREVRVVAQAPQVLGAQAAKELPKTGLPIFAWSALALLPLGARLKNLFKVKGDLEDHPLLFWEERQFKKGS